MGNKYLEKLSNERSEFAANTLLSHSAKTPVSGSGWQGNLESFAKKGPGLAAKAGTKVNKVGLLSKLTKFVK